MFNLIVVGIGVPINCTSRGSMGVELTVMNTLESLYRLDLRFSGMVISLIPIVVHRPPNIISGDNVLNDKETWLYH